MNTIIQSIRPQVRSLELSAAEQLRKYVSQPGFNPRNDEHLSVADALYRGAQLARLSRREGVRS